jgi:hypothetical protein
MPLRWRSRFPVVAHAVFLMMAIHRARGDAVSRHARDFAVLDVELSSLAKDDALSPPWPLMVSPRSVTLSVAPATAVMPSNAGFT